MYRQPVHDATLKCEIIFLVTHGEIKTNGVIVFTDLFQYDLRHRFSELFTLIIFFCFEASNDQSLQAR